MSFSFRRIIAKQTAKIISRIVSGLEKKPWGVEIIGRALSNNRKACVHAIRYGTRAENVNYSIIDIKALPDNIYNFEDLYWLFNCNYSNRGIIAQDFDEAAYIFKVIRDGGKTINSLLEIGRFLGGSTLLIATAKRKEACFVSVDLKVKTPDYADDKLIKTFIDLVDNKNTELVVSDSRTYTPKHKIDFIFIDGDHSYEGVKADYEHYEPYLQKNAHVFFHDAVSARDFSTKHDAVYKYMEELKNKKDLQFVKDVGSIRHYKYTGKGE